MVITMFWDESVSVDGFCGSSVGWDIYFLGEVGLLTPRVARTRWDYLRNATYPLTQRGYVFSSAVICVDE